MAPKFLKRIGRGFCKMCCMQIAEEDFNDPAYGAEILEDDKTLDDTPQIPSPKQEQNEEDVTPYESCLSDWDNISSSSDEYLTCEESPIGSLMSDDECDYVEYQMRRIVVGLEIFKHRLQLNQTETMQSDADCFQRKLMETDSKLKKMFE